MEKVPVRVVFLLPIHSQLEDEHSEPRRQRPHQSLNFRTPALDLDCIYGRGPAVDPFLYENDRAPNSDDHGIKLVLGENKNVGPNQPGSTSTPQNFDVPRNRFGTAIIGDPRNN